TPEVKSIYDPVYIDLYVVRPDVICIEQHIIAHNNEHLQRIKSLGTKINPNNERGRTFCGDGEGDYFHKYPFGTVHYLITLLAREGIDVMLPSLEETISVPHTHLKTSLGQILLRADDALFTTLKGYPDNAKDWWKFLYDTSKSSTIHQITEYIDKLDRNLAQTYKNNIGDFFLSLKCDGTDGAFDNIINPDGSLQKRVQDFYDCIKIFMNEEELPKLPTSLILHEGEFRKTLMRKDFDTSILEHPQMYSYAYIYGPYSRNQNFSYTLNMTD
ncbi:MAG: hypothetical protein K2K25_02855, partial [Muribaculaceae bacterium]|nr:hypothetical protein [Muribaculaceae bacterium]